MPEQRDIAAIVLAGGRSRRFGADKLLHPVSLQGLVQPLIAHSLRPWLQVFDRVSVVVGPHSEVLQTLCHDALRSDLAARVHWVVAEESLEGMGRSLASGVAATADAAGWMIGLADMPAVSAQAIIGVRDALARGASIAAPCHDGRRGHPVGFAATYRDELLSLQGDTGARSLLEREARMLVHVPCDDEGILIDIDSHADLRLHNMLNEDITHEKTGYYPSPDP